MVGGVSRAGTEHHELCVGDLDRMRTDTKAAVRAPASSSRWRPGRTPSRSSTGATIDWFVAHQTSVVHINAMAPRARRRRRTVSR